MRDKFIRFLKDRHVWNEFVANVEGGGCRNITAFLQTTNFSYNTIRAAFVFEDTPEGYDFWNEIANAWGKHL